MGLKNLVTCFIIPFFNVEWLTTEVDKIFLRFLRNFRTMGAIYENVATNIAEAISRGSISILIFSTYLVLIIISIYIFSLNLVSLSDFMKFNQILFVLISPCIVKILLSPDTYDKETEVTTY